MNKESPIEDVFNGAFCLTYYDVSMVTFKE